MIPLWMFPVATACGNTMLLKPSEKDPGACMMLVELARQGIIFNQLNLLPILKYPRIRLIYFL